MRSTTTSIPAYLASLPADRCAALAALRKTILAHLPRGYEESYDGGFLTYQVPLAKYPDTYNGKPLMYAALSSQKAHMAVYLCNAYAIPKVKEALESGFAKAGKKLDMGKSCVRFKSIGDVDLPSIGRAIAATPIDEYVAFAKGVHSAVAKEARKTARATPAKSPAPAKKATPAKKNAAKR